jgi:hypothetical protein
MQVECCVCRKWKDHENQRRWFTPTLKQRRDYHFSLHHRLSHSYCPHCHVMTLEQIRQTKKGVIIC